MIPTPYILGVKRHTSTTQDAHHNAVSSYAEETRWPVHAIAPGAMVEPGLANRDLSVVAFTVLAPAGESVPTERDLVVLDGEDYEVNGRPADWSRGPWAFPDAGVAVELKRVEG